MENQTDEWIQAKQSFIIQYNAWKASKDPHVPQILKQTQTLASNLTTVEAKTPKPDGSTETRRWHRLSGDFFEYMIGLERANAQLQNQLGTALGNLNDAKTSHQKALESSHSYSQDLTSQLQATLLEYRKSEKEHLQQIKSLERDLEYLRVEFNSLLDSQSNLEKTKQKLIKEKIESLKEQKEIIGTDQFLINEFQSQIAELETANQAMKSKIKSLESESRNLKIELENAVEIIDESKDRDHDEHDRIIQELTTQLDLARDKISSLQEQLQNSEEIDGPTLDLREVNEWGWGNWIKRTGEKVFSRDIHGLRTEIDDLRIHRDVAFQRATAGISDLVGRVLSIPFSTTGISWTKTT